MVALQPLLLQQQRLRLLLLQQQHLNVQQQVDLHGIGLGQTRGVMMRTTLLNATMMEVLVVTMIKLDGMTIVQHVNVLIPV